MAAFAPSGAPALGKRPLQKLPPFSHRTFTSRPLRVVVVLAQQKTNANDSGVGPEREREIEALISKLKRRAGGGGGRGGEGTNGSSDESVGRALDSEAGKKKLEEVLTQEMREAEAFMSGESNGSSAAEANPMHKPKVSTWGVYPRPKNISSAYGGGKNVPRGGVNLSNEEEQKKTEETRQKLASYRKGLGIDVEKEERHRDEIEEKLQLARALTLKSRPYEAVEALESVLEYVSPLSGLGGEVYLELALTYDALGMTDRARKLYVQLRRSPFPHIARKVKELAAGFEAMEFMKVDSRREGLKVMDFKLPDFAALSPDRYDTSYSEAGRQKELELREKMGMPTDQEKATNNVIFLVFLAIVGSVLLNIVLRR